MAFETIGLPISDNEALSIVEDFAARNGLHIRSRVLVLPDGTESRSYRNTSASVSIHTKRPGVGPLVWGTNVDPQCCELIQSGEKLRSWLNANVLR